MWPDFHLNYFCITVFNSVLIRLYCEFAAISFQPFPLLQTTQLLSVWKWNGWFIQYKYKYTNGLQSNPLTDFLRSKNNKITLSISWGPIAICTFKGTYFLLQRYSWLIVLHSFGFVQVQTGLLKYQWIRVM